MKKLLQLSRAYRYLASALLALLLPGAISFAWNAVWHGTNWNSNSISTSGKQLAETFEFLYKRMPDPNLNNNNCYGGEILRYNKNNQSFECLRCVGSNTSGVKISSTGAGCAGSYPMCRVWYRISSTAGWSDWAKTPWAYFASESGWVEGPIAINSRSSGSPTQVEMKLECNQAPYPQKLTYKVNIDQWTGDSLSDITRPAGNTSYVATGISVGSTAVSNTDSAPNNAVFGADVISSGGNECHIEYRIAGDDNHWSYWQSDGTLAFTGRASGDTSLTYMNNTALQVRLCCSDTCI